MTRIIKKHKFISFCILVAVIACAVTFAAEFSTSEEDIRAKEKAIEETITLWKRENADSVRTYNLRKMSRNIKA